MDFSNDELVAAAKKYVFNNKEIVTMTDIYQQSQDRRAYIRVDRPDSLVGSTSFITSALSSGTSRSTNGNR
jgi:hypothetical protein